MSSYGEQIRHPGGALDLPQGGLSWYWWLIGGGIVALVLIVIFRPQWLAKIGVHVSTGAGAVGNLNPMGWV